MKVAFSLAFVTDPQMPDAVYFVCQQHHPENFWKPDYQRHDNGAASLQSVWLQSRDPGASARFLARLFPAQSRLVSEEGGMTLELEHGRVAVRTPAALASRFPGIELPPQERGPAFAAISVRRGAAARGDPWCESVAGVHVELV